MENRLLNHMEKYTKLTQNTKIPSTKTIIYTVVSQNPNTKEIILVQPCANLYKPFKVKATYRK